jgi:hypothetical protein
MMQFYFKKFCLLLFFCAAALTTFAQTAFTVVVSPEVIGKNEYANLRLTVTNGTDIRNISPPFLKDVEIVSGPSQETGMNNINGVVTNYFTLNYIIKPKRTGKFVFAGATANINGTIYKAAATSLRVQNANSNAGSQSTAPMGFDPFNESNQPKEYGDNILKKGESIPEKISKNMHVKLITSKNSCFVGEPIVATYKLYTRIRSEGKVSKNPAFNGFSVIDLQQPDISEGGKEMLDGREYNVYIIRRAQLYPLQSGAIDLETAVLDARVELIKENAGRNVDVFGGFRIDPADLIVQNVALSSKPVSINVKPLPEAGKPASFNGAVGKFNFSAVLEKSTFSTDEAGKLVLNIEGAGNLQLMTAPDILWPQQIEAFEAAIKDDLLQMDIPVSGQKTITIPFTVNAPGKYELPAINFSYFDPETATYKTISSNPIAFEVSKGNLQPTFSKDSIITKKPAGIIKKIFSNREWIVGFVAFLFVIGLWIWFRLDRKKERAAASEKTVEAVDKFPTENLAPAPIALANASVSQHYLDQTEACLNSSNCDAFFSLLNKELKHFFATKFALPLHDVSARSVGAAMDDSGYDVTLALQMQELLQAIELELYTPFSSDATKNDLFSRAQELVQQLCN